MNINHFSDDPHRSTPYDSNIMPNRYKNNWSPQAETYRKIDGCYVRCDILDDKILTAVVQLSNIYSGRSGSSTNDIPQSSKSPAATPKPVSPRKKRRNDVISSFPHAENVGLRLNTSYRTPNMHFNDTDFTDTDIESEYERRQVKTYSRSRSKRVGLSVKSSSIYSDTGTDSEYDDGYDQTTSTSFTNRWSKRNGTDTGSDREEVKKLKTYGRARRKNTDIVERGVESEPDFREKSYRKKRRNVDRTLVTDAETESEADFGHPIRKSRSTRNSNRSAKANGGGIRIEQCAESEPDLREPILQPQKRRRGRPRKVVVPLGEKTVIAVCSSEIEKHSTSRGRQIKRDNLIYDDPVKLPTNLPTSLQLSAQSNKNVKPSFVNTNDRFSIRRKLAGANIKPDACNQTTKDSDLINRATESEPDISSIRQALLVPSPSKSRKSYHGPGFRGMSLKTYGRSMKSVFTELESDIEPPEPTNQVGSLEGDLYTIPSNRLDFSNLVMNRSRGINSLPPKSFTHTAKNKLTFKLTPFISKGRRSRLLSVNSVAAASLEAGANRTLNEVQVETVVASGAKETVNILVDPESGQTVEQMPILETNGTPTSVQRKRGRPRIKPLSGNKYSTPTGRRGRPARNHGKSGITETKKVNESSPIITDVKLRQRVVVVISPIPLEIPEGPSAGPSDCTPATDSSTIPLSNNEAFSNEPASANSSNDSPAKNRSEFVPPQKRAPISKSKTDDDIILSNGGSNSGSPKLLRRYTCGAASATVSSQNFYEKRPETNNPDLSNLIKQRATGRIRKRTGKRRRANRLSKKVSPSNLTKQLLDSTDFSSLIDIGKLKSEKQAKVPLELDVISVYDSSSESWKIGSLPSMKRTRQRAAIPIPVISSVSAGNRLIDGNCVIIEHEQELQSPKVAKACLAPENETIARTVDEENISIDHRTLSKIENSRPGKVNGTSFTETVLQKNIVADDTEITDNFDDCDIVSPAYEPHVSDLELTINGSISPLKNGSLVSSRKNRRRRIEWSRCEKALRPRHKETNAAMLASHVDSLPAANQTQEIAEVPTGTLADGAIVVIKKGLDQSTKSPSTGNIISVVLSSLQFFINHFMVVKTKVKFALTKTKS